MRYVTLEKSLLDAKQLGQTFEKKIKDLQREIELLNGKIKQGVNDKTRICGILDEKVSVLRIYFLLSHHASSFLVSRTETESKRGRKAQVRSYRP
jgi:hypothetical protein